MGRLLLACIFASQLSGLANYSFLEDEKRSAGAARNCISNFPDVKERFYLLVPATSIRHSKVRL